MKINLFVPGRLCLFGEHSDWAGKYRSMNAKIAPGVALVTGIEQGIYATAEKSKLFELTSDAPEITEIWKDFSCRMELQELKEIAKSDSFFSYCAGVASYLLEWHNVGGIHIHLTKMDLPLKSGLSSSASICVLVCRAFNRIYNLNLNTMGEMNIAYRGELRTSSRCGRLDQACAFGVRPVKMSFDAEDVDVENFNIKSPLFWVFANLNASKDTIRILADLNKGYPFAESEMEMKEQWALGEKNQQIINCAIEYMKEGRVKDLGKLMADAQAVFDKCVAPMCPSQLHAPKLHATLNDPKIVSLTYGGKGVGSQGDGSVQFLARDEQTQKELVDYLISNNMPAYKLTIQPKHTIRKAIIPVAGFGTRLYPETRFLKKEFFPVVDKDNQVKPVILVLIEECLSAGIEDICLVLGGPEEREYYRQFFETEISEEHLRKLPKEKLKYEKHILEVGKKLHYVYQTEKNGFGDAVYRAVDFARNDPVVLLLGDTLYKSYSNKCCALQLMETYEKYNKALMSIHEVPLEKVSYYGITSGQWMDGKERILDISNITEKPTVPYAEEFLGVRSLKSSTKYFSAFGSYVLTPEFFVQLGENICNGVTNAKGEIEVTTVLEQIREKYGLLGVQLDGEMYDIGIPETLRNTLYNFGK